MSESRDKSIHERALALTKALMEQGRLIEAGFAAFALYVIPKDAPQVQFDEMKLAYMSGAEHVWSSVISSLDGGDEPSEADLNRMDKVQKEINEWRATLMKRVKNGR